METGEDWPTMNGMAIRHAEIITMDSRQPRAEAMVVREGRILTVGSWPEVAPHAKEHLTLCEYYLPRLSRAF